MSTPTITLSPVDPTDPQGQWFVVIDGQAAHLQPNKLLAERYASNLREQLLGEPDSHVAPWSTHNTRSALALLLVIVLLAITGYCTQARAAEGTTFGLHLATAHFGGHGLKPETPGLYARHTSGATGGCYRNSYDRWSCYAGHTWQSAGQAFALTAGAVTGYPARRVMPLLVPSARIALPTWLAGGASLRVAYIPRPMKHGTAAGLHLSTEAEF